MRYCQDEDFEKMEVEPPINVNKTRLCPDIPDDYKHYLVSGSINDKVNRTTFSVQIRKCDKKMNKNCKSEEEIDKVLRNFYFSTYAI